jgi:hypothetical protein
MNCNLADIAEARKTLNENGIFKSRIVELAEIGLIHDVEPNSIKTDTIINLSQPPKNI